MPQGRTKSSTPMSTRGKNKSDIKEHVIKKKKEMEIVSFFFVLMQEINFFRSFEHGMFYFFISENIHL